MRKRLLLITTFIITVFCFNIYKVEAYSASNYQNRALCGNFEVASFKSDGSINQVSCHNSFDEARTAMKNNGADDLAVMTKVNGTTMIVDANVAIVDLTINPAALTYYYNNPENTSSFNTFLSPFAYSK